MPDIFLSYNREDQAKARVFAEAFKGQGFDVWWDVGLQTGEAYDEVTENALRTVKAVVVLWSKRSVQSRWVKSEATLADRLKTLVPAMIEACERPIMFELVQTAELSHWGGDAGDRAWAAFLGDVKRFVAKDFAPVVAPVVAPLAAPTVQETLKPGQSGSAPSLAVLPFTNRSSLAEDEVFAEGMVEDVISALSQGVNVRVLGAMATANLRKGAVADLAGVGRQLGVRYLLEGNVRRVGASLRVTTQLLEAETGAVMWTAKFDRPLAELAELQEELVTDVAAALDTQIFGLEMERVLKKPGDITAWEAVMRATSHLSQLDVASIMKGIEEAKRAIAIAPDYGWAYAVLANPLAVLYLYLSPDDPAEVQRIRAIAERALELAPQDASVLSSAGNVLGSLGFPDEGIHLTERGVRKSPGAGMAHHFHGSVCLMLNRPEAALSHFGTAARLMPGSAVIWLIRRWQASALGELGRWEEAYAAADECVALHPTLSINHTTKARCCLHVGREAESLKHMQIALRLGDQLADWERIFRRLYARSPNLEASIDEFHALWAKAEAA